MVEEKSVAEELGVRLRCGVYGEATVFSVKIALDADVEALQEAIFYKKRYNHQYKFDSSALTLYLARKKEGENDKWLEDNDNVDVILVGEEDKKYEIDKDYKKMRPSWKLNKKELFGPSFKPGEEEIQVLVELPKAAGGVARGNQEWTDEDLSIVDPQVQLNVWKSVVRVSSEDVFSGTALVVDRTATHLYLLTNLHVWIDEEKTFIDHLSADFKKEINRYRRLCRKKNTKPNGQKRKHAVDSKQQCRKSPRTSQKNAPVVSDKPQVVIEQLLPGDTMIEVLKFSLDSDICWRCSADFDFAIFEVAVTQDIQLIRCRMSSHVVRTMQVHVFGFPGILQDGQFGHPYAIIPAEITGTNWNQMTLSALSSPGLSGSAIVCTKRGIPVGYIGGGFDGSEANEQYQSYGYTLQGIPHDLPSSLPPDAEDETKEEL